MLASLVLLALVFVLHGSALSGWWRWDDADHLLYALSYSPSDYFFDAQIWQRISPANFTPLLSLSYDFDLWLFGLRPRAFYLHHLLTLGAAAIMTFVLLTLWLPRVWALLGAAFFLIGAPTFVVAQQLMDRHYIDGLVLACIALYLFVLAVRQNRALYAYLGAASYLLAMLAKELYVPLLILLPVLLEGRLRERLRQAVPYLLAVVIYTCWRLQMLDTPLSGYSSWQSFDLGSGVRQLLAIPLILLGAGWLGWVGMAGLCSLTVLALLRALCVRRCLIVLIVALLLLLLPLLPLTYWPGITAPERFLFLVWWGGGVLLAWSAAPVFKQGVRGRLFCMTVLVVSGVAAAQVSMGQLGRLKQEIVEREVNAHFIWRSADSARVLMLSPDLAPWLWDIQPLNDLKLKWQGSQVLPVRIVADEFQLSELDLKAFEVWTYDRDCQCMVNISERLPEQMRVWHARQREVPLQFEMQRHGSWISWHFGSYTDGQYSVVGNAMGKVPLPRRGCLNTIINPGVMVVRYDSPEGWTTYSAPFRVGGAGIEWLAVE